MAYEIKAGLRLRLPVKFLDDAGKAEPVENPGITSSDPTVAGGHFDTNGDILVTRVGVGHSTFTVYADADTSEAVQEIQSTFDVFCPPVQATRVEFGDATTEPDTNLSPENVTTATAASGADATVGAPATEVDHPADSPAPTDAAPADTTPAPDAPAA